MKVYKNLNEQIDILKSRNMAFQNEKIAKQILAYENYYYVVNGYKQPFIASTSPETYKDGVSFNELVALYSFDRKLREILMPELLRIEHCVKSKIIDIFSCKHGHNHTAYLRPESFNSKSFPNFKRTNLLISELFRLIDKQSTKHDAVSHYVNKYGYVPLWVLSKVMTFGKMNSFYACMTLQEKQEVAAAFGLRSDIFKSLIDFVAIFRNKCAHSERIYCHKKEQHLPRPISDLPLHATLKIEHNSKGYKYGKQDVFALLIAMKYLMQRDRYARLIKRVDYALNKKLARRLHSIPCSEITETMGLKDGWQEIAGLSLPPFQ